jgi:subtilase family serine protease
MHFPPRIKQCVSAAKVVRASLSLCALLLIEAPVVDAATSPSTVSTATRAHPTAGATFVKNFGEDESISVVVGLKLRNSDELNTVVEALLSPSSPSYQQWLSDDELAASYLPTKDRVQAVVAHLTSNGFTNMVVADNNLLVTASGTAKAIRSAFGTQMAHFSKGGRAAFANLSDVTVPIELSGIVQSAWTADARYRGSRNRSIVESYAISNRLRQHGSCDRFEYSSRNCQQRQLNASHFGSTYL